MQTLLTYLLPALLCYPIGLLVGRRLGSTQAWLAIGGVLMAMVIGVILARYQGTQTTSAIVVGCAMGAVMGLRHGSGMLLGMLMQRPVVRDEDAAPPAGEAADPRVPRDE